jgi:hypothetical protein
MTARKVSRQCSSLLQLLPPSLPLPPRPPQILLMVPRLPPFPARCRPVRVRLCKPWPCLPAGATASGAGAMGSAAFLAQSADGARPVGVDLQQVCLPTTSRLCRTETSTECKKSLATHEVSAAPQLVPREIRSCII